MSKILLVEDSYDIMNLNASMLSMNGYEVLCADTLKKAEELLEENPDMIVLDILLPDGNGIDWCKRVKEYRSIPVLFLSALNENADIVAGLRAGGDDYLAKPYGLEVLLARVELRLKDGQKDERYLSFGKLLLDKLSDTASFDGRTLGLSQKEFLMLWLLTQNSRRGKAVSKEELLNTIWGLSTGRDVSSLYTAVSRLNTKLSKVSDLVVSSQKASGYVLEKQ